MWYWSRDVGKGSLSSLPEEIVMVSGHLYFPYWMCLHVLLPGTKSKAPYTHVYYWKTTCSLELWRQVSLSTSDRSLPVPGPQPFPQPSLQLGNSCLLSWLPMIYWNYLGCKQQTSNQTRLDTHKRGIYWFTDIPGKSKRENFASGVSRIQKTKLCH